ncbi:hypothetical protein RyT2_26530 [Pseudolactococcus yaeyamensis]
MIFLKRLIVLSTFWARKFENIFKTSRFIYEGGYYYTKKRDKKEKIIYPKVYLKQDNFKLYASFELAGRKFQDRFTKVAPFLEVMYFSDFADKVDTTNFVTYEFNSNASLGRIKVEEVEATNEKGIRLSKDFWWDWNEAPHLLIVGVTGGGKTVFLRAVLLALAKLGVVQIGDPKRADFVTLADLPVFKDRIHFELEDIANMFIEANEIMDKRYDFINKKAKEMGHHDLRPWYEYDLEPMFIVCDELNAFTESLSYRLLEPVYTAMTNIVLKGRQAGVFFIPVMQRPTTSNIPPNVRENMGLRISQGSLDSSGNMMTFGDINAEKNFKTLKVDSLGRKVRGRGYIAFKDMLAREYYAPIWDGKFSFYEAFEKMPRIELPDFDGVNDDQVETQNDPEIKNRDIERKFKMLDNSLYSKSELISEVGMDEKTYKTYQLILNKLKYPFTRNEKGHIGYNDEEIAMFDYVYQVAKESGKPVKEIFRTYLKTIGKTPEDVSRSPKSDSAGLGQDGVSAEGAGASPHP